MLRHLVIPLKWKGTLISSLDHVASKASTVNQSAISSGKAMASPITATTANVFRVALNIHSRPRQRNLACRSAER